MQPGQTLAMDTQRMAIDALAFAAGQYEVAHHALIAALYCAPRSGARKPPSWTAWLPPLSRRKPREETARAQPVCA